MILVVEILSQGISRCWLGVGVRVGVVVVVRESHTCHHIEEQVKKEQKKKRKGAMNQGRTIEQENVQSFYF